jgi:nitrate reductase (NAD(P)H)
MMSKYHVGTLSKSAAELLKSECAELPTQEERKVFLQPRYWMEATLCEKRMVSHDSRVFTVALEHEEQTLGLPVGQHLMLKVSDHVVRAYTPVSRPDRLGAVELLVKIYFKTPSSEGGMMTTLLESLAIGSSVEIKGPIGKFIYHGNGIISINGKERFVKSLRMICGGSGITPIFQILRAIMEDIEDATTCVVLDGNKTEEDILCKEELEAFATADKLKCSIVHTLTNAASSWTGLRGRISADLLKEWASPAEEALTLICGPPAMEQSVGKMLLELGWDKSDIVFF